MPVHALTYVEVLEITRSQLLEVLNSSEYRNERLTVRRSLVRMVALRGVKLAARMMREGSQADWICELRRRMSRTAASPQVVHKSSEDDDSRERIISIEHVDDESPGIFRTPKSGTQLRTLTDRKVSRCALAPEAALLA